MNSQQILNVVNVAQGIAAMLPAIGNLVMAAEQLPVPGAAKLETVRQGLARAYETEQVLEQEFAGIWPILAKMVSGMVATFKAVGVFKSAPPPPPDASLAATEGQGLGAPGQNL